ncbi:MAG: phosphotransferase [Cyanobacteria bacterium P01_F01_bin.3]
MPYLSLQAQLQQEITPDDPLADSIFGTTDIDAISDRLNSYCQQQFGVRVLYCTFAYLSVGATFVVELSNQQTVVLKAYSPQKNLSNLRASFQVQQALAQEEFPCPMVLQLPQQVGSTILTAQTFCDDNHAEAESLFKESSASGQQRSPLTSRAHIRRTMAQALAKLIQTGKSYLQQDLPVWMELNTSKLWHQPHNVLFDFKETAAGAEWIDDIARQAKQSLWGATGPLRIGHSDWSLQNMSFRQGEITCIYDWDSLRVGLEPCFVGGAARVYRHDWRFGPPETAISVAEVQDFIRAYETARGHLFTQEEHRVLGAAIIYTTAYGMRCIHTIRAPEEMHYKSAKKQLHQFTDCFLT